MNNTLLHVRETVSELYTPPLRPITSRVVSLMLDEHAADGLTTVRPAIWAKRYF